MEKSDGPTDSMHYCIGIGICMYGHTYTVARVSINRVRLPIFLVVSWRGKINASEKLVSRDGFGSPVPRQPAHLRTQADSGAYIWTGFLPSSAVASTFLFKVLVCTGDYWLYSSISNSTSAAVLLIVD